MGGQRRASVRGISAIAVAVAVGLSACAPRSPAALAPSMQPATPATAGLADVVVRLERPRYLAASERVEVVLVNEGADEVALSALQLRLPGFEQVHATGRDVRVRAGQRVDVPVPHGPARCDTSVLPAAAAVALTDAAGAEQVVPITASDDVLRRFHEDLCRPVRVAEGVDLAFSDDWIRDHERASATGTLRLRRRAARGPVTVEAAAGSVLLALRTLDGGAVRLHLPAGQSESDVEVRLSAERCEPHALAESKKTFFFPMWVRLGEDEPAYLELQPPAPAREALTRLLAQCMPT